jgi:hypothetical protein
MSILPSSFSIDRLSPLPHAAAWSRRRQAAGGGPHFPPVQNPGMNAVPHRLPQAPQLFGSVWVFTHAPPQQAGVLAGQTLPHAPQFWVSDWMATHVPRQQAWPVGQTCRQLPQLLASFMRLAHTPLQHAIPFGQQRSAQPY